MTGPPRPRKQISPSSIVCPYCNHNTPDARDHFDKYQQCIKCQCGKCREIYSVYKIKQTSFFYETVPEGVMPPIPKEIV